MLCIFTMLVSPKPSPQGVFCPTSQEGKLQQSTPLIARSAFVEPFEVSIVVRLFENRLLRHQMRHGNPMVSEARPSDPLGSRQVFQGASPINSTGSDQSALREDTR